MSRRRFAPPLTRFSVAALLVLGCSATPPPSATVAPSASASAKGGPTVGPSFPAISLNPSATGAELFAETRRAAELSLIERGREMRDAAMIRDVTYAGARGAPVEAWIVTPANGDVRAGVLFLHWRGEVDSDRDEFLDEAVALASRGFASILPTQVFPFETTAAGVEHDRVEIGLQVRDARRGLAVIRDQVGDAPLAAVGHDFGGMYVAILRGLEPDVRASVVMTAVGSWADWFIDFVHVVPGDEAPAYRDGLADVDPVTWVGREGATGPILFQFAAIDLFVSRARADAFVEAAGDLAEAEFAEGVSHALGDAERTDRDAWLLEALGID